MTFKWVHIIIYIIHKLTRIATTICGRNRRKDTCDTNFTYLTESNRPITEPPLSTQNEPYFEINKKQEVTNAREQFEAIIRSGINFINGVKQLDAIKENYPWVKHFNIVSSFILSFVMGI